MKPRITGFTCGQDLEEKTPQENALPLTLADSVLKLMCI